MSKYLELFKGSFNDSINEKTKLENKPYIGYSLTEGKFAYTVVPPKNSKIYYTTSDNQLVPTDINMVYNVINHTYENGKGVIEFDSVIDSIPAGAFKWCTSLTSIDIPNSITSIAGWAFANCPRLASIVIPNSVTSIGDGAFGYCSGLTSITIPNSVTSIGEEAFVVCTNLISITFEGTIGEWNSIMKGPYWNDGVLATYVQCTDGQVAL